MLESIEIKNFQSHNDTKITLHPGVNSIVGASDKGKSAILRSLYWVLTNRPTGISVVSDWARNEKGVLTDAASVTVTTKEGNVVRRIRTKDFNGYDIDSKILEAVGVACPQEVEETLNISDVNVQRQLDPPFLLSASPGEVARFLNSMIKLEEIDKCLSEADSRLKSSRKHLKSIESLRDDKEAEIGALEWVDEAQVILDKYKAAEKVVTNLTAKLNRIESQLTEYKEKSNAVDGTIWAIQGNSLVNSLKSLESYVVANESLTNQMGKQLKAWTEAASVQNPETEEVVSLLISLNVLIESSTDLSKTFASIESQLKSYNNASKELGDWTDKKTARAESIIAQLQELNETIKQLSSTQVGLNKSIVSTEMANSDESYRSNLLKQALAEYNEYESTLPKCSQCNQYIRSDDEIHSHS